MGGNTISKGPEMGTVCLKGQESTPSRQSRKFIWGSNNTVANI